MAVVWLDEAGWEDGDLPDVCMECGRPAPDRVKKVFVYQPPWVWVTLLLGILVLAIVILVTRKQRRSLVPMCPEHENHWRNRTLWAWGSFLGAVLLGILGVSLANLAEDEAVAGIIGAVVMLCLIGWIVAVAVLHRGTIRATEFSKRSIKLTNVSRDFVDAYDDFLEAETLRDKRKIRLDKAARHRWNESPASAEPGDRPRSIREGHTEDDLPPRTDNVRPG